MSISDLQFSRLIGEVGCHPVQQCNVDGIRIASPLAVILACHTGVGCFPNEAVLFCDSCDMQDQMW